VDNIDPNAFCSTREAAKILGISLTTAQVMVEKGQLKAWKTSGGHRRISLADVYEKARNIAAGSAPSPRSQSDKFAVLVIDDDPGFRKLLLRQIGSWKLPIEVATLSDGYEALLQVERSRPDLMLLDVGLPGIDGLQLLSTLRSHEEFNTMDIVLVSGLDKGDIARKGTLPPGVLVLRKPIPMEQLKGLVQGSMMRRQFRGVAA